jgi:cytochrome c oxidase subunit 3
MTTTTAETEHGHDDGHGHDAHGHHGPKFLAHHFDDAEQQFDSAKLGMWVFLVTEILMFGGLFAAFIIYKSLHNDIFVAAHHHLDRIQGGTNTIVLLFSSLTMALAVRSSQLGKKGQTSAYLVVTILCAFIFLVVKYFEYSHKIHDGLLPGPLFHAHDLPKDAHVFFSLYFLMTGLHGIHVVIGIGLITWVFLRNQKGEFSGAFYTPVEIVGLYWHLVDLIWIYLFPLLYLIGLAKMTTETHDATHGHHGHGDPDHDEAGHHIDPLWLYLAIFGALIVLTVVTIGASYVDFGQANTVIAVLIASTKASLVAVFFMHLRHDKPFHSLVLVSALFFLSFLFLFTLQDEGSRNDVDEWHGKPIEKPKPAMTAPAASASAPAGGAAAPAPAGHH